MCRLPDWHLCHPSGAPPAEHLRCKSQTDRSLPEWSYQVLSLHMKSCFTVWSHRNLPFSLKPFLLPSLFRVEGLMERKRLHCSVVRDHLNYKFNLWFTVTFHISSCFYFLQRSSTSVWLSTISNGYESLSTEWITVKTYFSAVTDRDSPKTNLMVRQAWLALPLSYCLECKLKKIFWM